jgi:hypothetical protein
MTNTNILIKKHYFLLIQIISEILSNNNNNINNKINDLVIIIKIIDSSIINKKLKRKIIIEIICKQNLESIEKLWEEYNKDKNNELINEEMQEYINGIYYMNKCDWIKAYECFLNSKNYEYCLNSYINYCFDLIENKKIKDIDFEDIFNNISDIQAEAPHLFIDFYEDFYFVISFIVNKDTIDYEKIIELLIKYLNEYNDNGKIKNIDEKKHRNIIKLLYNVILWKDRESEDRYDLILGGDEKIFKLNNILYEDKICLLQDILYDIIDYKNIQFSLK